MDHNHNVEQALRKSENKHIALINALPDLILRMSGAGIYLDFFCNNKLGVLGDPSLIGKSLYENSLLPPTIADMMMQYISKALQTGSLQIYEHELPINDRVQVEEVRITVCAENEVLVIIRNVSDRKQAEIALKQSQERLKSSEYLLNAMFMRSPLAIAITDITGKFVRTNPEYQKIVGYSEVELANLRFTDITLADDVDENLRRRDLVLNNECESYQMEKRFIRRDGSTVWVKASSSKIDQDNGDPPFFIGVLEDISDRKQAEASLQSLVEGAAAKTGANFFPALVEYIAKALNVRFVFVTRALKDQLKIEVSCIDGTINPSSFIGLHTSPCAVTIHKGSFECPNLTEFGFADSVVVKELGAVSYFGLAITKADGQKIGSICILDDKPIGDIPRANAILRVFAARVSAEMERFEALESLRELNQQLESRVEERTQALQYANQQLSVTNAELARATKLKDEFLANMSHELRTPLNAIIGYSEILQEDAEALGLEDFVQDLQKIHQSGRHLLDLINDILDMTKIEAGKLEIHYDDFDVPVLVQNTTTSIQPLLLKNNNRLVVNCNPQLGSIHTDMTRLRQVLLNVLSNACKFTKSGEIQVTVDRQNSEQGEYFCFTISDTGIGISPENIQKLFQPFNQADSSTTRQYGGTGLGLAISHRLCNMMGGSITVQSELGKGSTFTIYLPVNSEPAKSSVYKSSKLSLSKLASADAHLNVDNEKPTYPSILVIDDDPAIHQYTKSGLSHLGLFVYSAFNGEDGLDLAHRI